ncbi:MAG: ABC transporter permease [Hyphomicrobiales bacterium]
MISNYFKTGFRNLKRNKTNFIINWLGLSLSVAIVILIGLYVINEFQHDKNQEKIDRLYRLNAEEWGLTNPKRAQIIRDNISDIEELVTFYYQYSTSCFSVDGKVVKTPNLYFVDTNVFNVFSFDFLHGNPENALKEMSSLVITESMAYKIFGAVDVIGRSIRIDDLHDYIVTGVIKDPEYFHLKIHALSNTQTCKKYSKMSYFNFDSFYGLNFASYILLKSENTDKKEVEKKIENLIQSHPLNEYNKFVNYEVFPVKDIVFGFKGEHQLVGTKSNNLLLMYSLVGIAILILLIACINYINLTLAKIFLRYKEVGVRKVVGATVGSIMFMILLETFFICLLSVLFGLGLADLLSPYFEMITRENIVVSFSLELLLFLLGIVLFITILSGIIPAFSLGYVNPIHSLKGVFVRGKKGALLRRSFLIFQYTVAILLIISTIILSSQFYFLKHKDLGFDQEQVLIFEMSQKLIEDSENLKNDLEQLADVESVAFSSAKLGNVGWTNTHMKSDGSEVSYRGIFATPEFFDVLGIKLLEGRKFDKEDKGKYVIINKAAKDQFFLDGESYTSAKINGRPCIGICDNFIYNSLHYPVMPLMMLDAGWIRFTYVKVRSTNMYSTIQKIEDIASKYSPIVPTKVEFLNKQINQSYNKEEQVTELFTVFMIFAFVILCLGLLGVIIFILERKSKEMAIRSVLGAKVSNILYRELKGFVILIIISLVIATSIAFYFGVSWLESFEYHIGFPYWAILVSFAISFISTSLILSYHIIIRVKRRNPAEVLNIE